MRPSALRAVQMGIVVLAVLAAAWPSDGAPPVSPRRALESLGSGKIHAFFLFDTDDRVVGKSLRQDHANLTAWFAAADPARVAGGRPVVKTGAAATAQAVVDYCQQLTVGPNDAIFIFLGCHGERHQKAAHVLRIGGMALPRAGITRVLRTKQARLIVLITDSCYGGYEQRKEVRAPYMAPAPPAAARQIIDDLFFGAAGVVNLNSCSPGEYAWNGKGGGLMTAAFVAVCSSPPSTLHRGPGTRVTWHDVFAGVRNRVARDYTTFKEQADPAMRGYDKLRDQKTQTLYTFEPLLSPVASTTGGGVGRPAEIHVTCPAEARIYFDGYGTASTGSERWFVTPTLELGRSYHYTLIAERQRDGRPERVSQRVEVRPGQTSAVVLQFPAGPRSR